jgi:hypothetical protein
MDELVFSRHATVAREKGWSLLSVKVDERSSAYGLLCDANESQRGHQPTRYRLLDLDRGETVFETIPMRARLSSGQPLGEEFLLEGVVAFGDLDESCCVVNADGVVQRTIDLGVGIKDVQIADNEIWVSYLDEGVFSDRGEPGLACFDGTGSLTFSFREVESTGPETLVPDIADCYALNVLAPADVWLYYYTEFPLVHIRGRHVEGVWMPTPVHGAQAVAVRDHYVVFIGDYGSPSSALRYDLRTRAVTKLRSVNDGGVELNGRRSARGARTYVLEHDALWIAEV